MRHFLVGVFAFLLTFSCISLSHAAPKTATGVRLVYQGNQVDGVNWTPVIASTSGQIGALSVLNTGPYVLEIGIGLSTGASAADVRQIVVPASMPNVHVYPFNVGPGVRISVRQLTSAGLIASGELELNAHVRPNIYP